MGVAAVALLYGIVSFFRMIAALGKWNAWKKHGKLCQVLVRDVDTKLENYKNRKGHTYYRYALRVSHDDRVVDAAFEETVGPTGVPRFQAGDRAELLYVPAAGRCKDPGELKGAVTRQARAMCTCLIIFIATLWLLQALGG